MPPSGEVFSERRPIQASSPSKQVGESCDSGHGTACISDICLHTRPEPGVGYFCTQRCESDAQCPQDWRCGQVFPTKGGELCVPPEGWTGAAAEPR
ncbi:hypothetical protein [Myxococcus llanfairpwllgwyngyllgogerychwyrndrobwllllantysiliogogogochensis]|uniref:hypothetical protein n=1 Tax=Myxococcus llanfairpwllgwyngyllgogerychwyrndrobwllllantysiliogogogochensis TaxID=2590453 RepID=UPI0015F04EEB|nr:hypothetical protein [Myxococcus llanfairpwllgwyngyllgogerychwyrndrobwllllantysiliogogogochensis]